MVFKKQRNVKPTINKQNFHFLLWEGELREGLDNFHARFQEVSAKPKKEAK